MSDPIVLPDLRGAFFATSVCGVMNNWGYVLAGVAAQNLAKHFHQQDKMTALTAALSAACLVGTYINAQVMTRFAFYTRLRVIFFLNLVAFAGTAASCILANGFGFALAIFFLCFGAFGQVFGEATNIAFLRKFPAALIGAWGAGTGIAGIGGSIMYIGLTGMLAMGNEMVFLVMVPTVVIYAISFHYLHSLARDKLPDDVAIPFLGLGSRRNESEDRHGNKVRTAPLTCASAMETIKFCKDILFNLVAVYFLEYLIFPGLADRESICSSTFWYPAMALVYGMGVTVSRLSVSIFRIQRVWVLTCFQAFNVCLWSVEVYTGTVRNAFPDEFGLIIMTLYMFLVGLCAGAAYGNCMYLFNTQAGIPDTLRELGINIGFMMVNIGIGLGNLIFVGIDSSILSKDVLYPGGCGA